MSNQKEKNKKLAVHFTSKSQTWNTPKELFDKLNSVWNFEIDTACERSTALCKQFFTPETDGLSSSWECKVCFNNPPYDDLRTWCKKCADEFKLGSTVVQLIPSRTDTRAFHESCFESATLICFIKGRLKFSNNHVSDESISVAPFPSCIVVYDNDITEEKIEVLKSLGKVVKVI